jgi:hypothetical protein
MRGGKTQPEARRWAEESRMTWNITLTLTIPNIYHTAVTRATGAAGAFTYAPEAGRVSRRIEEYKILGAKLPRRAVLRCSRW